MTPPHSATGECHEQVVSFTSHHACVTFRPPEKMAPKDVRLLGHLMQGRPLAALARQKCRSLKTLYARKYALYRKLGIESDITLYRDLIARQIVIVQPLSSVPLSTGYQAA